MSRVKQTFVAVVVGATVLTASPAQVAADPVSTTPRSPFAGANDDRGVRAAVHRLRDDAAGRVEVRRSAAGLVDFVASSSGEGVDNPARSAGVGPVESAYQHLDRYGAMFGVRAPRTELEVAGRAPSTTDGSLVRFQQTVSGLPVFGGELVVSLEGSGDLKSVLADTTAETQAGPVGSVSEQRARRTAVKATAAANDVDPAQLVARGYGTWFYDPALVGAQDRLGARQVWRFEVGNGSYVRDLVLVDAASGRVALRFNQVAEALDRVICDQNNAQTDLRSCTGNYARDESMGPSSVPDVNAAFFLSGKTARMYANVAGTDLTELVGLGPKGSRKLASTVRWCGFLVPDCPMANAFWSGRQMYYGDGFAAADDVVAHELTHGFIERYSNLLYFHQSGAINESMADVMGEILDHRNRGVSDSPADWSLGEDLPIGAIRDLADPTRYSQPDRMTSNLYVADTALSDNGGVHTNSGVGNKTAHLIAQGGTFNGVAVAGIDRDAGMTKTATLYVEVIRRLTSGSDYADLRRVLVQSCKELTASGKAGFKKADCVNVSRATRATELGKQPVVPGAAAPEAPRGCPAAGTIKRRIFFEDVDSRNHAWWRGKLWRVAPYAAEGLPPYATSGRRSFFGWNPDPFTYSDPNRSNLSMRGFVRLPAGQKSYLRFRHAYWFESSFGTFPDGGMVKMRRPAKAAWRNAAGLRWFNGPRNQILGQTPANPSKGFGGISSGYVSSRANLSHLAGKRVKFQWQVAGDSAGSLIGWFIDDVEIYTCPKKSASKPRNLTTDGGLGGVELTWSPPSHHGSGLTGYRVTRSDDVVRQVPPSSTSVRFGNLQPGTSYSFKVQALNRAGEPGAAARVTAGGTVLRFKASAVTSSEGFDTALSGRLTKSGAGTGLGGRWLSIEHQPADNTRWRVVDRVRTRSDGRFRVRLSGTEPGEYAVVFSGGTRLIGTRSASASVRLP